MRKTVAIFLLFCFALYQFGYYVAYFSFRLQIENHWSEKIYSENQSEFEERIMEIPLSIPYMADEEEFRATNTSFQKDGQYYRVIKQRYINDTLQIVYVPDSAKKNLDKTIKQWVSSLVHDELPDSGSNSLLGKIFVKDYTQPINEIDFSISIININKYNGFVFLTYQNQDINLTTPPPELV
ncbi:hypothetical protein [Aquiflexum sp.]|uniref:hypothetical protein n=1 Tax=Aquiflexum sp. TaxID=1872584 RepID=UPI0035931EA6